MGMTPAQIAQAARDLYASGMGPANPQATTANPYASQQYVGYTPGSAPGGGGTYDYGSTGFNPIGQNAGGATVSGNTGPTAALNQLMQNPAYFAMAQAAGVNPTYNGGAVSPWGAPVEQHMVGGGVVTKYPLPNGQWTTDPTVQQAAIRNAGGSAPGGQTQQTAQAAYAGFRPPAQASAGQAAAQAAAAPARPFGGALQMTPIKLSGIGAAPAGAGGAGGAGGSGGGISGSMTAPSWRPPSAVGLNMMDPNAATAVQEGQQNAAVAALQQYQQGLGSSALTRNLEAGGAALAGSTGPIDPALAQRMQSQLLETNAASTRDAENAARDAMGAQGRLGSGAAPVTFSNIAMQGGRARNDALTQQQLGIAQTNQAGRVANVGAATGALGTIGNLAGAAASRIADVYGGTQYDDQGLAKSLYGAMLGAGGGYGQGQAA